MDDPSNDAARTDPDPHVVSVSLRQLGEALDESGTDLEVVFRAVTQRFAEAVDSLVAVSFTIVVDGAPFTIVSPRLSTAEIASTMSVPFVVGDSTPVVVVLAASRRHAFTTLARDAASELGVAAGIEHDRHFRDFEAGRASTLSDRSVVDHAIGILLDRGNHGSAAAARAALTAQAAKSGRSVGQLARDIVDAATAGGS